MNCIGKTNKSSKNFSLENCFIPFALSLSVFFLSLGGIGGSLQLSRLLIILLMPFIIARLFKFQSLRISGIRFSLFIFCFGLLFYSFMSLIWTEDILITSSYLVVLMVNITPLMLLSVLNDKELILLRKYLPLAWLFSGLIVIPLALYELTTGNHFFLSMQDRGGGEITNSLPFAAGFHGNLNDFSLYLFFCVFGVLLLSTDKFDCYGRVIQVISWFLIIVILSVLLVNGSRGIIVSISVLLIFKFMCGLRFSVALFIIIVLFVCWSFFTFNSHFLSILFLYLTIKFGDFSSDLESSEGRFSIILAGLPGILDSFGLGVGAGASSVYLERYSNVLIPNPHNLILEWLLNFGVIGLLLFAGLLFKIVVNCLLRSNINHRFVILGFMLTLPVWGVVQSHLTGYTYFWLAIFTSLIYLLKNQKT